MPKRVVGTPQRRTKKEKKSPNDGHSLKPNEYGFLFRDPLHPNTILFRKERPSVVWDVVEVFDNGSERNFRYYCHGCQAFCRCTTITIIMRHLQDCTLSKIEDEETRMKVLEGIKTACEKHFENEPNHYAAKNNRALPNPENGTGVNFKNDKEREKFYQDTVARYFLANNLPMTMVEDPNFRQFIYDISKLNLEEEELEWLQRKKLGDKMEDLAEEIQKTEEEKVEADSKTFGSSIILDGWTGPRVLGVIGIIIVSFLKTAVKSFIECESSSTAEVYYRKVKYAVDLRSKLFICTDGAANMVKLGATLLMNDHILPIQCVTHGFSLICHYICQSFDTELVSKVCGVISFFTRSPQRMHELRQAKSNPKGLGYVSVCRTRFAFVVFSALRLIRLREATKEALDKIKVPEGEGDKLNDFEKQYSTWGKVRETIQNESFFEDLELYIRLAYPVMLIMREFDTAAPMMGFVYWAFANVRDQTEAFFKKMNETLESKIEIEEDPAIRERLSRKCERLEPIKQELLESIDVIWEKRHSPLQTVAYLLNPLFHQAIYDATDGKPLEMSYHFADDVEFVLKTLVRKMNPLSSIEEAASKYGIVLREFCRYIATSILEFKHFACEDLAADFWQAAMVVKKYPALAPIASRIQAAPCVSSKVERYFSRVGNTWTTTRNSLSTKRASLFSAANFHLNTRKATAATDEEKSCIQKRLLKFVKKVEECGECIPEINEPGFGNMDDFLERYLHSGGMIYKDDEEEPSETTPSSNAPTPLTVTTSSQTETSRTILEDFEKTRQEIEPATVRRSTRDRKSTPKMALLLRQTEFMM